MLNADIPVPTVLAHRAPTYGLIFHSLLVAASPATPIHSVDFDVQKGEYPPSLDDFDALIISGSASSAYDDEPWVRQLEAYIRDVYTYHPRVKIFGSCFGHQVVCQSLLGDYGVIVEKDGKGWEIGVKEIRLHKEFLQAFGKRADVSGCSEDRVKEKVRLQFVHHDHVVIPSPESLPISWVVVGRTEHCAVQGVYEAGRVFTLQGHFEFDRFVNSEVIKAFLAASWSSEKLQEALDAIDADDDSVAVARMVVQFFSEENRSYQNNEGLLTPP